MERQPNMKSYKKGDQVYRIINKKPDGPFRVMAEVDGYLMVRRKGCVPFVMNKSAVVEEWKETQI